MNVSKFTIKKKFLVNLFNWVNLVKRLDYTDGYNTVTRVLLFRTLGNIKLPIKTLLHVEVMHEWANIKEAVTSAVSVRAVAARLLEGRG